MGDSWRFATTNCKDQQALTRWQAVNMCAHDRTIPNPSEPYCCQFIKSIHISLPVRFASAGWNLLDVPLTAWKSPTSQGSCSCKCSRTIEGFEQVSLKEIKKERSAINILANGALANTGPILSPENSVRFSWMASKSWRPWWPRAQWKPVGTFINWCQLCLSLYLTICYESATKRLSMVEISGVAVCFSFGLIFVISSGGGGRACI